MISLPARLRRRRAERICTVILIGVAAWYWLRYFNRSTNLLDEGSTAAQALRILNGQLIYRDFFTVVTPGSYYTIAWLFQIFGHSLMVMRWAALVTGLGVLVTTLGGDATHGLMAVCGGGGAHDHGVGMVPEHAEFLFA